MREEDRLAAQLTAINGQGVILMEKKQFAKALKVFKQVRKVRGISLREIPENAIRPAANIFNNMGACNIRGNLDIWKGIGWLIEAKNYYVAERRPSEKHLNGIKNRLEEAKNKLQIDSSRNS